MAVSNHIRLAIFEAKVDFHKAAHLLSLYGGFGEVECIWINGRDQCMCNIV